MMTKINDIQTKQLESHSFNDAHSRTTKQNKNLGATDKNMSAFGGKAN